MATKKEQEVTINVLKLKTTTLDVHIVGSTPLIFNAMSKKVKEGLLCPKPKKSKADQEQTLKHNPFGEYRDSVYRTIDPEGDPLFVFPGGGAKKAIASAALDIPGAAKTQIGRLSWVDQYNIPIWGVPQMLMSVVRNADKGRTPDVRTRAILPEWCAKFSITFTTPQLNEETITNLTAASGIIVGWGDWRNQKGSGTFGQFRICKPTDADYKRIMKTGGRVAQEAGLRDVTCFDHETTELLEYFEAEAARRDFKVA